MPKYGTIDSGLTTLSTQELYEQNKQDTQQREERFIDPQQDFANTIQTRSKYGTPIEEPIGNMFIPFGGVKPVDENAIQNIEDLQDIPEARAQSQTGLGLLGNSVGQFLTEATLGMGEAVSYMLDFDEMTDYDQQSREGFDNFAGEAFREAKNYVQDEIFPIYRTHQAQSDSLWDRMGDATFWASQGRTMGTTVALMAPSLAVGALTGGLGAGSTLSMLSAAMVSGKAEAAMEANGTFQQEYNRYMNEINPNTGLRYTDYEARELAGQSASTVFKANAAMLPLDMLQYATMMKAFAPLKGVVDAAKATKFGKVGAFGLQMGSESAEELYQSVAQEEAIKQVREGITPFGKGFGDRMSNYIKDPDIQEAALMGAITGGVFESAGGIYKKVDNKIKDSVTDKFVAANFKDSEAFKKVDNRIEGEILSRAAKRDRFDSVVSFADGYLDKIKNDPNISEEEKLEAETKINNIKENAAFIQKAKGDIVEMNPAFKEAPDKATEYAINKYEDKKVSERIKELEEKHSELKSKMQSPKDIAVSLDVEIKKLKELKSLISKDNNLTEEEKAKHLESIDAHMRQLSEGLQKQIEIIKSDPTNKDFKLNEYTSPYKMEYTKTVGELNANKALQSLLRFKLAKDERKSPKEVVKEQEDISSKKKEEITKDQKETLTKAANNTPTVEDAKNISKEIDKSQLTPKEKAKLKQTVNKASNTAEVNNATQKGFDWSKVIDPTIVSSEESTPKTFKLGKVVTPSKEQMQEGFIPPPITEIPGDIATQISRNEGFVQSPSTKTATEIFKTDEAVPRTEEKFLEEEKKGNKTLEDKNNPFKDRVSTTLSVAYRAKEGDVINGRTQDRLDQDGNIILLDDFNHQILKEDYLQKGSKLFFKVDTTNEFYEENKNDINNVPIVITDESGNKVGYVHEVKWLNKRFQNGQISEEVYNSLLDKTTKVRNNFITTFNKRKLHIYQAYQAGLDRDMEEITSNINAKYDAELLEDIFESTVESKSAGWLNQNFKKPKTIKDAFSENGVYDDTVAIRTIALTDNKNFSGDVANPELLNNSNLKGIAVVLVPGNNGQHIAKRLKQFTIKESAFGKEAIHNVMGILLNAVADKTVSRVQLKEELNKYIFTTSYGGQELKSIVSGGNQDLLFNVDLFDAATNDNPRNVTITIHEKGDKKPYAKYKFVEVGGRVKVQKLKFIPNINDTRVGASATFDPGSFGRVEDILFDALGNKYLNVHSNSAVNPREFSRLVADEKYQVTRATEDYRDYLSDNNIVTTFIHGVTTNTGKKVYATQPNLEYSENLNKPNQEIAEQPVVDTAPTETIAPKKRGRKPKAKISEDNLVIKDMAVNNIPLVDLSSILPEDFNDLPEDLDFSQTRNISAFSRLTSLQHENDLVASAVNYYVELLNKFKGDSIKALQQIETYYREINNKAIEGTLSTNAAMNSQVAAITSLLINNFEKITNPDGTTKFVGYKNLILLNAEQLKFNPLEEDYSSEDENEDKSAETFDKDKNFKTDPEKSASARVKRALFFIPEYENGQIKRNIIGQPVYKDYYKVFNAIINATADVPITEIVNELKSLDNTLKDKEPNNLYQQVLEILAKNTTNDTLINEFHTVFTKQRILMQKLIVYPGKTGELPTNRFYLSNKSGAAGLMVDQWKESHKKSELINKDGSYNQALLKKLKDKNVEISKILKKSDYVEKMSALLNSLGLKVSEEALIKLADDYTKKPKRNPLFTKKGDRSFTTFRADFKNQITYILDSINKLKRIDDEREDGSTKTIFTEQPKQLLLLAKYEAIVNPESLSHSFRNGNGDVIYGFVNPHFLSNTIYEIKNDLNNHKRSDSFSKKATWDKTEESKGILELNYFDAAVNGKTDKDAVEFEAMSPIEKEQFKAAAVLGNTAVSDNILTSLFLTSTPSDKTTFALIRAIKKQIGKEDLTTKGKLSIDSPIVDELYDLLVQSELDRINQTALLFREARKSDNWDNLIEGEHYSVINNEKVLGSGGYFFLIPEMNNIFKPWLNSLDNADTDLAVFGETMTNVAKQALVAHINKLAETKYNSWNELGMFGRIDVSYNRSILNKLYNQAEREATPDIVNRYTVMDYIINNAISYANQMMLITGDPSTFVKPNKSWDGTHNTWESMVDGTIINMFKRIAKDIAPGYEGLFDESEKTYNVLFINEPKKSANIYAEYEGALKERLSKLTDIEFFDAQKLTSLKEHVVILAAIGRITREQKNTILEKYKSNQDLTDEELGLVLQPLKPVEVGRENSGKFPINYYIKSSSYPLIPQLTKGLQIDALRRFMESNNIDAIVPHTAVKNGFHKPVTIFKDDALLIDEEGTLVPENFDAAEGELSLSPSIHVLSREYFRIQQDVPFNPNKSKILEGSQLKKLKYSDLDITMDFYLDGTKYKGEQLKELDDEIHIEIYKRHYEELTQKLKATYLKDAELYVADDITELKKVMIEEALTRGFDYNDVMLLENLLTGTSSQLALFMHPALPKVEALLNSLIKNKILITKFPGKSYIQGASMGFEKGLYGTKEVIDSVLEKTGIILTSEFNQKKGLNYVVKKNPQGEDYVEAQVFLPWMFKEDIESFITPLGTLDTTKIDTKLLELIGYRIPTQDHGSMVILKPVGFLPKSSGDLIIVPPQMSKLMGSDFDVDKLFVHKFNYRVNKATGGLEKISSNADINIYRNSKGFEEFTKIYEETLPSISEAKNKIQRSWDKQSNMLQKLLDNKNIQENQIEELFYHKKEKELQLAFAKHELKEAQTILDQLEEGFEEDFASTGLLAELAGFTGDEFSILNQASSEVDILQNEILELDADLEDIANKLKENSKVKIKKVDVTDRINKRIAKQQELLQDFYTKVIEQEQKLKAIGNNIITEEAFNKLSRVEKLTMKQLQNLSLDITHSILQNAEIAERLLTPLDNNDIQKVLNTLKALKPEVETSTEVITDESKPSQTGIIYDGLHSSFVDINAAGQIGVGIGSIASTSHVLAQYSGIYLKKIYLPEGGVIDESVLFTDKKDNKPFTDHKGKTQVQQNSVTSNKKYKNAVSKGLYRFDRIFGVTGKRISQVIKNLQTEAVDNAKNQRLFGMNLNKHTFNTAMFLAKAGLDEKYLGFFLNQPIILDYVRELNSTSDIGSSEFKFNKQEEIQNKLFKQYGGGLKGPFLLSLEEMEDNLKGNLDTNFQAKVLSSFINYAQKANGLSNLFRSINTDTKYLEKDITSTIKKRQDHGKYFYLQSTFGNTEGLEKTLQKEAYRLGVDGSLMLYKNLVPYNTLTMIGIRSKLNSISDKEDGLNTNDLDILNKAIKNSIWVKAWTDTFNVDVNEYRNKLLFGENSLANRLIIAKETSNNTLVQLLLPNTSNDVKTPHTIEFPTAGSLEESFTLRMQQSFLALYNDKKTKKLAEDLVGYIITNGNERGARDFARFLPIDLYHKMGLLSSVASAYSEVMKEYTSEEELNENINTGALSLFATRFVQQYLQHNPSKASKANRDSFKLTEKEKLVDKATLEVKDLVETPELGYKDYIFLYEDGIHLYKREGNIFTKLPLLGNKKRFISEYDLSVDFKESLFKDNNKNVTGRVPLEEKKTTIKTTTTQETSNTGIATLNKYGFVDGQNLKTVLENIANNSKNKGYSELAKILLSKYDKLKDINLVASMPEGVNVVGRFYNNERRLHINPKRIINLTNNDSRGEMSSDEFFELVFLHETIHGLTSKEIASNPDGEFVQNMNNVFQQWKANNKNSKLEYFEKNLQEFVSGLFTEERLQRDLANMKGSGDKNLLEQLWDYIIKLLVGDIEVKEDSLLMDALKAGLDLFNVAENQPAPKFTTSVKKSIFGNMVKNPNISTEEGISDKNVSDLADSSEVKDGVYFVFEQNPELSNIGTQEQYSKYLNTIFPNSAVKDIVYHATTFEEGFNEFYNNPTGTFFSRNRDDIKGMGNLVYGVVVNLKNPYIQIEGVPFDDFSKEDYVAARKAGSFITGDEIAIFNHKDSLILGSKQDIEGFKRFMKSKQNVLSLPMSKTRKDLIDNIDLYKDFLGNMTVEDITNADNQTLTEILKKICK